MNTQASQTSDIIFDVSTSLISKDKCSDVRKFCKSVFSWHDCLINKVEGYKINLAQMKWIKQQTKA